MRTGKTAQAVLAATAVATAGAAVGIFAAGSPAAFSVAIVGLAATNGYSKAYSP